MKIVSVPNSILTGQAKPVRAFDERLLRTISEMSRTLAAQRDPEGVGLAAPQVGLPLQLFIMKARKNAKVRVFVNPKIVSSIEYQVSSIENPKPKHPTSAKKLEGCLSIPRIWGHVSRVPQATLSYQDETGKTHEETFSGFEAIIVQHEMDHLQGILFTKRVVEQNQQLFEEKDGELVEYSI